MVPPCRTVFGGDRVTSQRVQHLNCALTCDFATFGCYGYLQSNLRQPILWPAADAERDDTLRWLWSGGGGKLLMTALKQQLIGVPGQSLPDGDIDRIASWRYPRKSRINRMLRRT
jgi:hypothetical protein